MVAHACEVVAEGRSAAPCVITCEHASHELPAPWRWHDADRWLSDTHWAYDIGAVELARELAAELGAALVAARFSRLLVDANRAADSDSLFLERVQDQQVELNRRLDAAERERRMAYWRSYHDQIDQVVRQSDASIVLAIHSFTDVYAGRRRDFDIGVLFDQEEQLAQDLAVALQRVGEVRLNEPYSGKQGMIYSATRHAADHGRRALEIEARQDRLQDPEFRRALVSAVGAAMKL